MDVVRDDVILKKMSKSEWKRLLKLEWLFAGIPTECRDKCRWKGAVLILCAVGLFKEFRPSGPFLVDYAVDYRNFTLDQMTYEVIPSTTMSFLASLVFLLLVTDALCYKPIIIMGSIATVITWALTIWYYDTVKHAKIRQLVYGYGAIATEVAYFTYMYANIEKKDYKKVTSYTHSAVHVGQFLSGLVGQILLSFHILGLDEMNYISFGSGIIGLAVSLFLPRVFRDFVAPLEQLEEIENEENAKEKEAEGETVVPITGPTTPKGLDYGRNSIRNQTFWQRWRDAPKLAWDNFRYAYTNKTIIKYSLWWALSYGLYIHVDLYIESLWKEIEHHSHQKVFNGAVHASHAVITVVLGLLAGHTSLCWYTWGSWIFGFGTVLQGVALGLMAYTENLYIAYACFIVFQTGFQVLVIISKSQVAESVRENSEAFIFGMNTLAAVLIHLALTIAFTGPHGWRLPIRDQFWIYGVYTLVLAIYMFICAISKTRCCTRRGSWTLVNRRPNKVEGQDEENKDMNPSMPYSIPREH